MRKTITWEENNKLGSDWISSLSTHCVFGSLPPIMNPNLIFSGPYFHTTRFGAFTGARLFPTSFSFKKNNQFSVPASEGTWASEQWQNMFVSTWSRVMFGSVIFEHNLSLKLCILILNTLCFFLSLGDSQSKQSKRQCFPHLVLLIFQRILFHWLRTVSLSVSLQSMCDRH